MKTILAVLLLALFACTAASAEVPVRTEQLIWSVLAFNGRDYSPAFATEVSDTVYILAGADSFFSARKTLVYWWPITSEWKTDTDSLNVQFPGTLEVRDARGRVTEKPLEQYTYFNVKGEYELNWNVVTGGAASAELAKYAALYDEYFKAVASFQLASAAHDEEMQSLASRIQKLREQKQDFAALLERMKSLPRPVQPQPPAYYVVPPAEMQQGFILNLAPGSYSIRLVNPDGTVMEGSEKLLVVHDSGRTDGVGFEVIPSDRWTRPEASVTPSSVLYVNGSADLYLRPFFEKEFNDLAYERTLNTAARGNPNISKWVRIQQVPHAAIVLEKPGAPAATLAESPFYVEQAKGSTLGYTIQPFDPAGAHKDKEANLIAFRVQVERAVPALRLHARDATGARIAGSERQIRLIGPIPTSWVLLALALAPLLVMAIVLAVRSRTYARGSSRET